jgi:hypothetical protein
VEIPFTALPKLIVGKLKSPLPTPSVEGQLVLVSPYG